MYITPEKYSEIEILKNICVSSATYFREKKKAIILLVIAFFMRIAYFDTVSI